MSTVEPCIHGGRLREMAARYRIPLPEWLDLSTGINPNGWPVPALSTECWCRLPEEDDGLKETARAYYRTAHVLPVAGSQAAIQMLPRLRRPGRVGIITPGYAEHRAAWTRAGHRVLPVVPHEIEEAVEELDVLVLINPNNPTGHCFEPVRLLMWRQRLAARGGWLVVDEAFMDSTPEWSVASAAGDPGLVVLRSLGKFFGLAGARVGFVLAWSKLLTELARGLGPWAVSGPAREVTRLALEDEGWQTTTRGALDLASARLAELLQSNGLPPDGGTALFQWVRTERAAELTHGLAEQGIYVRRFDEPASLRLGLPGSEADWVRLEMALARGT